MTKTRPSVDIWHQHRFNLTLTEAVTQRWQVSFSWGVGSSIPSVLYLQPENSGVSFVCFQWLSRMKNAPEAGGVGSRVGVWLGGVRSVKCLQTHLSVQWKLLLWLNTVSSFKANVFCRCVWFFFYPTAIKNTHTQWPPRPISHSGFFYFIFFKPDFSTAFGLGSTAET